MNTKTEKIRIINANHLLVLIILFTVFISVIGKQQLKGIPYNEMENCLIELDESTFEEAISRQQNFVLFYSECCDISGIMQYNLTHIAESSDNGTGFFQLNLDKHPKYISKYNISGTPTILIFSNGGEVKRIMGMVSESNLNKIYNRTIKKEK